MAGSIFQSLSSQLVLSKAKVIELSLNMEALFFYVICLLPKSRNTFYTNEIF